METLFERTKRVLTPYLILGIIIAICVWLVPSVTEPAPLKNETLKGRIGTSSRTVRPFFSLPVVQADDIYFAYYVRAYVINVNSARPVLVKEGPMTLAQGVERAETIMREGLCVLRAVSYNDPGGATCYPPSRVLQVDVHSPS